MRQLEQALGAYREHRWLGWNAKRRLLASGDARVLDACLDHLERTRHQPYERALWTQDLSRLLALPVYQAVVTEPARVERWVALLAGLLQTTGVTETFAQGNLQHPHTVGLRALLKQVLAQAGTAAAGPLRRLIAGPRLGWGWSYVDASADYVADDLLICPKGTALQVYLPSAQPDDERLMAKLVTGDAEDPWTRVEAAVVWHRLAGADVCAAIVAACADPADLSGELGFYSFTLYGARLATLGPDLVPFLIPRLSAGDYRVRSRAAQVLLKIGKPAVPALVEVVRQSAVWEARQNAEEVLRVLDRHALWQAMQESERDARGLSPAAPSADEATRRRGLSRAPSNRKP